ncbi:pentatricopeptide repeat-containing protein At2g33680 [Cryptomeria japonica]|uniref:pentatricopeptide repeat-containing protein At2g33680 n=1 Tax=Cryptomeria japonica TaxID=3369 RepID=UPI0027DA1DED|nr:pentatricopeptide repeat-containing protein At2g33680 [Cryptomeria japonica]
MQAPLASRHQLGKNVISYCKSTVISVKILKLTSCTSYARFSVGSVRLTTIKEANSIHTRLIKIGFQSHVSSWNSLLQLYTKSGKLVEARQVFDQMPDRNAVSWNVIISGYVQHEYNDKALKVLVQMQGADVKPNGFTFSSVLRACAGLAALEEGKQIHAVISKVGFGLDVFIGSSLVDMYAKCRQVDDAQQMFDKMPQRSGVSWNALLAGYAHSGYGVQVLKLFCHMQEERMKPTEFTFSIVLMSCSARAALEEGKQLHAIVIKSGIESNVFVGSTLTDMYSKCSSILDAHRLFERMPERNVVSWTAMIAAYAQHQCINEVLQLLKQMQLAHVKLNQFTINSVLSACASPEALDPGKQVHALLIKSGFQSDICVGASLVTMYAKCGCVEGFVKVYETIPEADVVSWNAMIAGYAQNGYGEEALQHFTQMLQAVLMPDFFTFASILKVCANLAILEQGKQVHTHAIKTGASAQHGRGREALLLFEQMQEAGVHPDHITFIGLLSACSHVGFLDEGWKCFDLMSREYGIKPRMEHYSCIVDLLCRGGQLDRAEAFIHSMPLQPSILVWKTLLSACRIYGNMGVGKRVAEYLLHLDPQESTNYILLSNMFAAEGKWDDAARIRKTMNDGRVKKEPGCSWVEVNKSVHAFVTEDRSHEL